MAAAIFQHIFKMKQLLIFTLLIPCFAFAQTKQPSPPKTNSNDKLSYETFMNPDKTYGYDIFRNNKLFIHQPNIPGRAGNSGFKTEAQAKQVAELVVSKIKRGMMPPTVEEKELRVLKI